VLHAEVLKAKRFLGEHLPDAGPVGHLGDLSGHAGSPVPHPLHHLLPEVA
jgi:hypothetical protein